MANSIALAKVYVPILDEVYKLASLTSDEVPLEERYLYITPTLHGLIQDLDTTKSREVLARFSKINDLYQNRTGTESRSCFDMAKGSFQM